MRPGGSAAAGRIEGFAYLEDPSGRLQLQVDRIKTGARGRDYGLRFTPQTECENENEEHYLIEIEQLERVVVEFEGQAGLRVIGWGADESHVLPIGSTLDSETGVFYWMPGPGFLGKHVLHFALTNGVNRSRPVILVVNIVPKRFN